MLYFLEMHCASERGQLLTGGYTLVSVTYCLMHLLCSHFNKRKKPLFYKYHMIKYPNVLHRWSQFLFEGSPWTKYLENHILYWKIRIGCSLGLISLRYCVIYKHDVIVNFSTIMNIKSVGSFIRQMIFIVFIGSKKKL